MTEQEAQMLIAQGDGIDAEQVQHTQDAMGVAQVAPNPDAAAMEWFIVPKALAWLVATVFPETAPAYTDEKCLELARAIVPVAEKYGMNGPGDSPELTLLGAAAMFGMPGYMAYKKRKADATAKAEKEAEGAPDGSR